MSSHPISTYRALTPSLTSILAQDKPYTAFLHHSSPFYTFVTTVESYELQLKLVTWGVTKAESFIIDDDSGEVPREKPTRLMSGKMSLPISDGLMKYTTAIKLVDIMAWLQEEPSQRSDSCNVLMHQCQGYFVGNPKFMNKLSDPGALLKKFCLAGLQLHQLTDGKKNTQTNATAILADEVVRIEGGRNATTILKNLANVSFALHIMLQGFMEIPEDFHMLNIGESDSFSSVVKLMANAKSLRQPLRLCVNISPLVALVPNAIEKYICPEETLLNMKALGNQKSPEILQVERELWQQLFYVATGSQTVLRAFRSLQEMWKSRAWDEYFGNTTKIFPTKNIDYSPDMSVYQSYIIHPIPSTWNIPPAAHRYIKLPPNAANSDLHQSHDGNSQASNLDAEHSKDNDNETSAAGLDTSRSPGISDDEEAITDINHSSYNLRHTNKPPNKTIPKESKRRRHKYRPGINQHARNERNRKKTQLTATETIPDLNSSNDDDSDIEIIDDSQLLNLDKAKRQLVEQNVVNILTRCETMTQAEAMTDLEQYSETIPLVVNTPVTYFSDTSSDSVNIWTADGDSINFKPRLHNESDHDSWMKILRTCEKSYRLNPATGNQEPLFLSDPNTSAFVCMSEDNFFQMPVEKVQALIALGKNIVKTNCKRPTCRFDLIGLETLAELDRPVDIQDQSIPVADGNYQVRVRKGTVQDLFNASSSEFPQLQRSLNALDFPHAHADISPSSNASDVRAFSRTHNDTGCSNTMPTQDMRWGIAATTGAHHYWHLDSRGEGTFIFVCCGEKLWIVATPKDPVLLSEITLWHDLDVTDLDPSLWLPVSHIVS